MDKVRHPRHRHRPARIHATCSCPAENVLGQLGKGLRIALTVLDFGRTTFGASCTGVAKTCLQGGDRPRQQAGAVQAAAGRVRAGQEEDRLHGRQCLRHGSDDRRVRRASSTAASRTTCSRRPCSRSGRPRRCGRSSTTRCKSTAARATSRDEPYERMMRDARINKIGEGANDVLQGVHRHGRHARRRRAISRACSAALKNPLKEFGTLWNFGRSQLAARFIDAGDAGAEPAVAYGRARELAARVRDFGLAVIDALKHFRAKARSKNGSTTRAEDHGGRAAKASTCRNAWPTPPAIFMRRAARWPGSIIS